MPHIIVSKGSTLTDLLNFKVAELDRQKFQQILTRRLKIAQRVSDFRISRVRFDCSQDLNARISI